MLLPYLMIDVRVGRFPPSHGQPQEDSDVAFIFPPLPVPDRDKDFKCRPNLQQPSGLRVIITQSRRPGVSCILDGMRQQATNGCNACGTPFLGCN